MPFCRLLLSAILLFSLILPTSSRAAPTIDETTNEEWIEVSSANFRVVTEQPEKVARQMVIDLENLRYISNRLRGATSLAGPPLTIVALGRESAEALEIPKQKEGIFQLSRLGYSAIAKVADSWWASEQIKNSRDVFLHEYHHFLLMYSQESTAYPLWYNEGMSEYWSSMHIEDGKVWFGDHSRNFGRERDLFDRYGKINIDTRFLFNSNRLNEDGSEVAKVDNARFYSRARFTIHYFNSTPELRRQLAHYLRLYNMGWSQDQAVRVAFKKNYYELDAALREYIAKGMVRRGFDIGPDGLDLPRFAVKVARLDRAAAVAVLADVVPRFIARDSTVTKELVATNLALNPDDPNAHALDLELKHVTVRDALEKLTELEHRFPNNPRLLALHADILANAVRHYRASGGKGWETGVEEARGLYRRSIAASPFNPRAYSGLGDLYAAVPDLEPVDEGIAALDTAAIYERRPQVFRALADLYLRKKLLWPALQSIRSAVAFNTQEDRPFDILLLENLELLMDLADATPDGTSLKFKSGATYSGPMRDGKPEGIGTVLRPDGATFYGEFKNGLPSGHGRLASESGVVYEGDFSNGYALGKGRMSFSPADKFISYEGEVAYATPNGMGVLVTRDGRTTGTFRSGTVTVGATTILAHATPGRLPGKFPGKLPVKGSGGVGGGVFPRDACKDVATSRPDWCRYNEVRTINLGNTAEK